MRTLSYLVLLLSCLVARGQATLYNSNIKLAQVNGPRYTNVTSGLVGWWKFDEGTGVVANDSSGQGNTGYTTNNPTWVTGVTGTSLNFNGNSQFVGIGNPSVLNITGNITVSAWIFRTNTTAATAEVVSKGYDGSKTAFELFSDNTQSYKMTFQSYNGSTHGVTSVATNTLNVWEHWVGTWNGSVWTIYKNGSFDNSNSDATGPQSTVREVEIAGIQTSAITYGAQLWKGYLDDIRIHNRALSATEVWILYNWRP